MAATFPAPLNLYAPLLSPTLVTPALGVATATTVNKVTITAPAYAPLATPTFTSTIATAAPAGSSAGAWKLGALQAGAVVLDTTRSIFVDIGGVVYKLMVAS